MRRIALGLAALATACGGGSGGGVGRPFTVAAANPTPGSTDVPLDSNVRLLFSQALDPASVGPNALTVATAMGTPVAGDLSLDGDGTILLFQPASPLDPSQPYTATVGEGVHSLDGRPLGSPFVSDFVTLSDTTPPTVLLSPADGALDIATNARISAVFSEPIVPASVGPAAISVVGPGGAIAGNASLVEGNRVLRFTPSAPLPAGASITVTVAGGAADLAGNALPSPIAASFTVGTSADSTPPTISLSVNGIPPSMNGGIHLPRSGFTLQADFADDRAVDPGSFFVAVPVPLGPEGLPTTGPNEDLFAGFSVEDSSAALAVPSRLAFPIGATDAVATVEDLAGNQSPAATFLLETVEFPDELRPFEQAQRVWVAFDLDRGPSAGGNGLPDFDDDLLAYGLLAAGDPAGTNAAMGDRCRTAVLEVASGLLEAAPGARIELSEVPPPPPFTRIAVGGIDPADLDREIGDPSTGVIGRAWFDAHNEDLADDDTLTSPPLGVFPGEIFIAVGNTVLGPGTGNLFGQTFSPLAPAFGGTPAGAHPLDGIVLAPGFDPAAASAAELARFLLVALAVERLSLSTGAVLAHELGHSFGLVETGPPPTGLHGSASKHNLSPSAFDVMVSSFSWNNLALLPLRFRPLNRAYLREEIVLE